jgi:hypothetical protein
MDAMIFKVLEQPLFEKIKIKLYLGISAWEAFLFLLSATSIMLSGHRG